ncbi:MAG: efflux RND transporter periplasmic adaptor subunit [Burkholderiales bacterium]|nr:efflux RND transporter periplasmic adaptor subunit [Burkholderiales bacterium]
MSRRLRLTVLALGLVAVVAGGLAWRAAAVPEVPAVAVRSGPLVRSLLFTARVATASRVEVGATLTGRVEAVAVREGDAVRAGQTLVALERAELAAALAQAQASERQAAAVQCNAAAELARAQELVQRGFLSASRLDEARRAEEVALAQAALARSAVQAAQVRLAQTVVVAPAPARVLARQVEPGQIVSPGRALLTLALEGPVELVAQVDERYVAQLRPGQAAQVEADAFPGQPFAAQVRSLAPLVDAQRGSLEVKLAVPGEVPAFLREDMTLSVQVETARRERTRVLPAAAVSGPREADTGTVRVVQDGRVHTRPVRLGLRTLDEVEVLDGLAEGDTVLLAEGPADGARVRPVTAASAPARGASGASQDNAGGAMGNAFGR